jgi:hypothetical protein
MDAVALLPTSGLLPENTTAVPGAGSKLRLGGVAGGKGGHCSGQLRDCPVLPPGASLQKSVALRGLKPALQLKPIFAGGDPGKKLKLLGLTMKLF